MSEKKKALGKGLNALISGLPEELITQEDANNIKELELGLISPNKNQPRKHFNPEIITELATSIKENGVIQPIVVSPLGNGRYQIVVGERRFRAAKEAGLKTIPCVIKDLPEAKILEWALIENLQREDLNAVEIALAYQELMRRLFMTQEEFATYIGKSRSAVANTLRLLKLPQSIQEDVAEKKITEGHARAIVSLNNIDEMIALRNTIIEKNFSVREAENYLKQNKAPSTKKREEKKALEVDKAYLKKAEEMMGAALNTKVVIVPKTNTQGKIEVNYMSLHDFELIKKLIESLDVNNKFWL